MTKQTLALLRCLVDDPATPRYGLDLAREARLKTGTVYPALARLERAGWLESYWEEADPAEKGRPRRRLYRLIGEAVPAARRELQDEVARLTPRSGMQPSPVPSGASI